MFAPPIDVRQDEGALTIVFHVTERSRSEDIELSQIANGQSVLPTARNRKE
jgi:hypothetical protein